MIGGLPPMAAFPDSTPRYPNLWICVAEGLAGDYWDAVSFTVRRLEECAGVCNDFGYLHVAEGCDYFARRRGLVPVELRGRDDRSHDHELHLRFYTSSVRACEALETGGNRYYRIPISAHLEVDRPARLHAYVDECPVCGCTGDYASYRGAATRVKNERVHDPLGLELLLHGTVRGRKVVGFDGLPLLRERYELTVEEAEPARIDINTARVAGVFFVGRRKEGAAPR